MNYLDLFSGIGGFRLGAQWAGLEFENEFHSDIDNYANKVYAKHFPDSIPLGDITKIKAEDLLKYGNEWIITGGFPCQDISIAGKGAGITGERSGLWSEYWRLIRGIRPRIAIIENVPALTFRGLDRVLADLAQIGYDAEWQNISAAEIGAWHKRERIWIVAYPMPARERGNEREGEIEKNVVSYPGLQRQEEHEKQTAGIKQCCEKNEFPDAIRKYDDNTGYGASKICRERPEKAKIQRCLPNPKHERYQRRNTERTRSSKSMPQDTQRRTGQRTDWSTEPELGRLAHGIPNRVDRLKCLGNSIVPQIAHLLFEQIKKFELIGQREFPLTN